MPQIRQFTSPVDSFRPSETGVEATAQAARLQGRFFNQAGGAIENEGVKLGSAVQAAGDQAVDYETHREISHGAAAFAQLNDNLTQAWNDRAKNADPNDPAVAAKFREEVLEPALQKYNDAFVTEGGQKFAQAHTALLRDHMFEKTAADMSKLAGDAVRVNVEKTANSLSNTAMSDPSSVDHLLASADGLVAGIVSSSPNLKGADAASARMQLTQKMKETIAKSAAFGAIQKSADPEATAAAMAAKYPDYINGQEEETLARAAKTQSRTNVMLEKQTQLYQKQLDTMAVDKAANKAFTDNVTIDATTNRPNISPQFFKDALAIARNHPDAPNAATTARTYLDWGEAQQKPHAVVDDPDQVAGLMKTLSDPNTSANAATIGILKAEIAKGITPQTGTQMRALVTNINDLKDPALLKDMEAAKEIIEPTTMGIKLAPGKFAPFFFDFINRQYLPAKRAGTLPPNALDMNDPESLISKAVASHAAPISGTVAANGGVGATPKPAAPQPGTIQGGYRFIGGDPSKPENWAKVQ